MLAAAVLIILGLVHCVGDYFLKRASITFTWSDLLIAIALYTATTPGYLWLMKFTKLAILASMGAAVNIIVVVTMGVMIFHEQLTTREILGVVLAVVAVAMFYK